MTNSARLSGRPSSSAAYNVGDVVDTPDSAIKSWRYLGAGEWEPNDAVRYTRGPGGGVVFDAPTATAISALGGDPDAALTSQLGTADNISGVVSTINAQAARRARIPAMPRADVNPKINLIGAVQNGKSFQGFPSAVRLADGTDLVIYREGVGHLETTPIASTSQLTAAIRPVNGRAISSRTTVFLTAGVDPRDPNILRDDHGNAVLVGGLLKVVIFEYAGNYNLANCTAKVYNLDPANLAAGLVNPVVIPSTVKAVKSDVRKFSDGTYGFVGYDASNNCYFVQTADWLTFTAQAIGPGNEAALCETADGMLNVVVRTEEQFIDRAAVFYKRALSGGNWYVHDVLPYTLNAPTFVKFGTYSSPPVTNGNMGWGLFFRDKTGRIGLTPGSTPVSNLLCLRSKDDYGRSINKFQSECLIAGLPIAPISADGDAHYCSVIAGTYSANLEIYTYGSIDSAFVGAGTSFVTACYRISATFDPVAGVRAERLRRHNWIRNGDFRQGAAGYDIAAASASNVLIINDATTGNPIMQVLNAIPASVGVLFDCEQGETLFPKIRMRTLNTNNALGRHLAIKLYDYGTGAAVIINTVYPELLPAVFEGQWRTVVLPPIVAPSKRLLVTIGSETGITAAESHISHFVLSDDYTPDLPPANPLRTVTLKADVTFSGVTAGGQKATATYSNSFWSSFGVPKRAGGLPYGSKTASDISIRLTNVLTQSGALRLVDTGTYANSDGTVTANVAVAPGESGTISATVTATALVTIVQADFPFPV